MKTMKQRLAVMLAVLLIVPTLPVSAQEPAALEASAADVVRFNTGNHVFSVINEDVSGNETVSGDGIVSENETGDACFEEDGSYTINIPEENPFFPYEVQFTCNGEVTNQWFMTPDDSVEVGGHTFYVSAYFDNSTVTQMSLNVAGDKVVVYPETKEFTDSEEVMPASLLPLEQKYLNVSLLDYTPAELTMVSVDSIFTGETKLTSMDKVIWTYGSGDDYTISASGDKLDLSRSTNNGGTSWQMIVGDDDQLAADNIRYIIRLQTTKSRNWLLPSIYIQDSTGSRTAVTMTDSLYNDYSSGTRRLYITAPANEMGDEAQAYMGLGINPTVFENPMYNHIKIYEGQFATASEAMSGTDITNQILNQDMTQPNAGYVIKQYYSNKLTMVTFDADNNVTGCLPFEIQLSFSRNYVSYSFYKKTANGTANVLDTSSSKVIDDCRYTTLTLYSGYADNDDYALEMYYYKLGASSSSDVTAAYVGRYSSIAEAASAGAVDIKSSLFSDYYGKGYVADYSQGVYFTIFIGEDGSEQEIYKYNFKTQEGNSPSDLPGSGTNVQFTMLNDSNGNRVDSYIVKDKEDSYAEYNYLTILVDKDVDLTSLAPVFITSSGVKLYAAGSSAPEVSGESLHDFSNGPIQYTASAEDGKSSKNYWVQIVKPVPGADQLYMNSLADTSSDTRSENGVIYTTREMMLDGYHEYVHDIWLANISMDSIASLSAELKSDVVELDNYWTLSGNYDLSGFTTVKKTISYGELPNLAKLRIKVKDGVANGTDISGTLTLKSGGNTLMVVTLTGTVGDPCIITEDIPKAVKYVPYGTMIQNNNKYSWNSVSYSWIDGELPEGMWIKPNGEIYGVPTETGEFIFTVSMSNSYNKFSYDTKTYTLSVIENTNENVDAATDPGYDLSQRVETIYIGSMSSSMDLFTTNQTLVSQGIYEEFVDIYLDGHKLKEGEDYTSESGSTRITILTQTLVHAGDETSGTHTLGIEFRTQDTNTLKRAAQNYTVDNGKKPNPDNGDSGDSDQGNDNNDNGSSNGSGSDSSRNSVAADLETNKTVTYVVKRGDTLWKIAAKFYGSGEYWKKIFADNAGVISNPDRISVGQTITIYLNQGTSSVKINTEGSSYTVKSGDNLWKIAQQIYGSGWRWKKIYQANKEVITDSDRISVGQVLIIPGL